MICYEYINQYIKKLINKNQGILGDMEEYAHSNHIPIIHLEVANFLSVIGNMVKPKKILEIGTAIGYSAIFMSGFLETGGSIDTIERNYEMVDLAKENIKKAQLEDVIHVLIGDALNVLRCLDKKYDMIFLDGAKGKYSEFLPECLRMLNPSGVLISDNVLFKGMVASDDLVVRRNKTIVYRMKKYLFDISNHEELITSIIPIGDGVSLSFKHRFKGAKLLP